jgi:PLP dependent protein
MIKENLLIIKQRITEAEKKYQRPQNSVSLLAVSKTKPISAIEQAIAAGQKDFGENYCQDAKQKILHFQQIGSPIIWHFIGSIQTNKTQLITSLFDWVHSVDRLKIAIRLNQQRPTDLAPLNICLQVNLENSPNKSGLSAEDCMTLAKKIADMPNLKLRGLMCIPDQSETIQQQRQKFAQVSAFYQQLKQKIETLDTLSMGMSGDLDAAIAEGSTMVRIGTDIFGARDSVATV